MKIKPVLYVKQLTPLIEILIVMTFFAGASVILAQIFSKAYNDSRLAHDINSATLFVGECAERIRALDYNTALDLDCLQIFEKDAADNVYRAYLDSDFAAVPRDKAYAEVYFEAEIKENEAGSFLAGRFICTRNDGEELINIKAAVFYGR